MNDVDKELIQIGSGDNGEPCRPQTAVERTYVSAVAKARDDDSDFDAATEKEQQRPSRRRMPRISRARGFPLFSQCHPDWRVRAQAFELPRSVPARALSRRLQ